MGAHEQLEIEIAHWVAVEGGTFPGRSRVDRWIDEDGELHARYS